MHQSPLPHEQFIPNRFYYNELLICFDKLPENPNAFIHIKVEDLRDLQSEIANCLEGKYQKDVYFYGYDSSNMFSDFKSIFKYMRAAGGLVQNKQGENLFIKRFGIWDLPKGKLEKGEKAKTGAIREVIEETGINDPRIIHDLPTTFHIYRIKEKFILKETEWFLMYTRNREQLIPQLDEDITVAEWLSKEEANKAISGSYRSLRDAMSNLFDD